MLNRTLKCRFPNPLEKWADVNSMCTLSRSIVEAKTVNTALLSHFWTFICSWNFNSLKVSEIRGVSVANPQNLRSVYMPLNFSNKTDAFIYESASEVHLNI